MQRAATVVSQTDHDAAEANSSDGQSVVGFMAATRPYQIQTTKRHPARVGS